MTTFSSDKSIQKHYDRTVYKFSPAWIAGRRKRVGAILCAVLIPFTLAALVLLLDRTETGYALMQSVLLALLLPFIIFTPIAVLRYKNQRAASMPAAAGRYGDTLLFDQDRLIYTFRNRFDSPPRRQQENVVLYSLVQQAVAYRRLQTLLVLAGGVDTNYNSDGSVHHRQKYIYRSDGVTPAARWVEIPLTYADNEAFLQAFQQACGVTIEVSDDCKIDYTLPHTSPKE